MEKAKATIEAAIKAEETGDLANARQLYEQASLLAPEEPFPQMRLAFLLLEERKLDQAIRVARQLIKRWPRLQPPYVAIAQSYARLGRWRLAERFYRQALAIEEDSNVLLFLGVALSQLKQNDEAEEYFCKSLDPNDGWSMAYLADALTRSGKLKAAEKEYRSLIELWPNESMPYWAYGGFLPRRRRTVQLPNSICARLLK